MKRQLQKPLVIGNFMSFNNVLENAQDFCFYDIETDFLELDESRTIVNITPTQVLISNGGSFDWKIEYLDKEVIGGPNQPKKLRVHYSIKQFDSVKVKSLSFSGIIVAGYDSRLTSRS